MRKDGPCNNYSSHLEDGGEITSKIKEEQTNGDNSNEMDNVYTRKIFNCPTCKKIIYMEYRNGYVNSCCGVKYKGTNEKNME